MAKLLPRIVGWKWGVALGCAFGEGEERLHGRITAPMDADFRGANACPVRENGAGKRLWHWGWILLGAFLLAPSTAGAVLDTFLAQARALLPPGLERPALVRPLAAAVRLPRRPLHTRSLRQPAVPPGASNVSFAPRLPVAGHPVASPRPAHGGPTNPRAPPA